MRLTPTIAISHRRTKRERKARSKVAAKTMELPTGTLTDWPTALRGTYVVPAGRPRVDALGEQRGDLP